MIVFKCKILNKLWSIRIETTPGKQSAFTRKGKIPSVGWGDIDNLFPF